MFEDGIMTEKRYKNITIPKLNDIKMSINITQTTKDGEIIREEEVK